jgi:hypothetical protein
MTTRKHPPLDMERVYEAIEIGVHMAFWRLITNSTDQPSHDFYDAIGDAVERAFTRIAEQRREGT